MGGRWKEKKEKRYKYKYKYKEICFQHGITLSGLEEDGKRRDEGRNAALVRGFKCDIAEDSVAQTQIQIQI